MNAIHGRDGVDERKGHTFNGTVCASLDSCGVVLGFIYQFFEMVHPRKSPSAIRI